LRNTDDALPRGFRLGELSTREVIGGGPGRLSSRI
jgi:hypothetical protein